MGFSYKGKSYNISFRGVPIKNTVIDKQEGSTCWAEAMENLIQVYFDMDESLNGLSKLFMKLPSLKAHLTDTGALWDSGLPLLVDVLKKFEIDVKWCKFPSNWTSDNRSQYLTNVFNENRLVMIQGTRPIYLDERYGGGEGHVILLSDKGYDKDKKLYFYGADSNFDGNGKWWSAENIQSFIGNGSFYETVNPVVQRQQ